MATILLVDDDAAFTFATSTHLTGEGHDVISVDSAMRALEVLETTPKVDMVLTDVILRSGEPNGISLARMAQMKRPKIKTVLMTGYRDIAGDEAIMRGPCFISRLIWTSLRK